MEKPVIINKVKEEWGSLGNMSKHPITMHCVDYPRAEHLFQALRLSCDKLREEIRSISNPMAAKMRAKKLMKENPDKLIVEPQSQSDILNMELVLRLKVTQHQDVRELLIATQDRTIVEDATRRQRGSGLFWGAALQEDGSWKGDNWLGKLWMRVRDSINIEASWKEAFWDPITQTYIELD